MWELDHKEGWALKNWCFQNVVLEKILESPWTARRPNQSILKEISPEYSPEGLMLKLKLQYFGHMIWRADSLKKTLRKGPGKDWRQEKEGTTENKMAGCHHWLNGHKFEQGPGDGEGQGMLECWSSRGCKESDMTDRLNDNTINFGFSIYLYIYQIYIFDQ